MSGWYTIMGTEPVDKMRRQDWDPNGDRAQIESKHALKDPKARNES
jgi:hypothetical protein